jgi:hypothetical protein
MKNLGRLLAIISIFGMLLGFIPLLGWLNWLVIPVAIIGLLFSVISGSRGAMIICIVAIVLGMLRLKLGFGII